MKKLLILSLLVLSAGCVNYYHPKTALEDGVYYAEDDPSYVVYQGGYAGAAYYPWSSLDYFYMGFNPYPRYTYFYGFPFGFSYGYSPWYYPYSYFGYYSPLYSSYYHYPHLPVWRPYNGYCSHYGGCGHWNNMENRDSGQNRYAGNARDSRRNRDDEDTDGNEQAANNFVLPTKSGGYSTPPYNRYASTAPSGYSGNRGLMIRSSETTKIGKSRIQPVESGPFSNNIVISARPSQTVVSSGNTTGRASGRSPSHSTSQRSSASSGNSNRSRSSPRSSGHRAPRKSSAPAREKLD